MDKHRVALVTGGMGGLGEAICIKLAALGYTVVTTYSPGNTKAAEWLDAMKKQGFTFHAHACDVADWESAVACVKKVAQDVGPVEVLVNNAGITRDMTFKKMDKANWDAVLKTKAGMHGFTKALALEYARKGVTVNTISPGYIGTKMVMAIPKEVLDSKIIPQIPMGRLGKPEEVAGLVAYLSSEEAAFLTGANIAINGGQHMF